MLPSYSQEATPACARQEISLSDKKAQGGIDETKHAPPKPFKPSPWVKLRTEKQLRQAEEKKPRLVDRFVKISIRAAR